MPDEQKGCHFHNGYPMAPVTVELHDQLFAEVGRLVQLLQASTGPLTRPEGYAEGYKKIRSEVDGERSEFSKRLMKARALFEALAALQIVEDL